MIIRRFLDPHVLDYEDNSPVSQTIPDQSLTVRDIITRFTRGQLSLPDVETGDDDDIDSDSGFDDFVDASDSFDRGLSVLSELQNTPPSETPPSETPPSETPPSETPSE